MPVARSLLIVSLGLWLTHFGCITPQPHYGGPDGPAAAAKRQREAEQSDAETLIRVDHEGNVYRGEDPPAATPREGILTLSSARRTTSKRTDAPKVESAAATDANSSKNYGELATAIGEPQIDAERVAELVAAHERSSPPFGQVAERPTVLSSTNEKLVEVAVSATAYEAPQSTPKATTVTLPAGVFPTVVRATRFDLEYDDQVLGEGGIAKVELYGTRDAGRTWDKLGEDDDRRSPYTVEMPEEGVFGFRIAVAGKNGLASRPPKSGELPELWVRVDLSEPMFRANLRPAGDANDTQIAQPSVASPSDTAAVAASPSAEEMATEKPTDAAVAQASHVEVVATAPPEPSDWKSQLTQVIAAAESELAGDADEYKITSASSSRQPLTDDEKRALSAHLRLMYLAAGRHEDAIKSSAHHDEHQNEFWSHQMHGLKLLVEPTQAPAARQASAALAELCDATDKLATLSELQINSLSFCTAANSFGVYETTIAGTTWKHNDYSKRKFEPEQPIVLYFEVANFASEQTSSREYPDGAWRTSLRGSYTIVDSSGSPVEQRELQLKDDVCRNRRHDYYVAYKSWIPKLNPGNYSLELLVEDAIAGKIGTSSIDFEVIAE